MVTDTQVALSKGMKAAAIFMGLTSAFVTVWHDDLIYKLYSVNLPTTIIRWLINFLTNRTTKIKAENDFSDNMKIQRGVP